MSGNEKSLAAKGLGTALTGGVPTISYTGAAQTINPATLYTLTIDIGANQATTKRPQHRGESITQRYRGRFSEYEGILMCSFWEGANWIPA
jgi:hypothetical protein